MRRASYGKIIAEQAVEASTALVFNVLDGEDLDAVPSYAELMQESAPNVAIDRAALEEEARRQQKQNEWLKQRGLE